ncbi:MAG: hypothetical protein SVU32_03745 [Candidatus Nanohaloarchaea archaeon]|nr:hypothetical protein [Candidatus Nanohaloarchaea archaeon]
MIQEQPKTVTVAQASGRETTVEIEPGRTAGDVLDAYAEGPGDHDLGIKHGPELAPDEEVYPVVSAGDTLVIASDPVVG